MGASKDEIPEDLAIAIEFHGHLCPGLVTGYLAAKLGLERLAAKRSEDEELIAIVENDTCAVDAVQVLTGCTFGKGNLFFHDHGKMVFTFAVRPSGRAIRISRKHKPAPSTEQAPEDPQQQRCRQIQRLLQQPADELFSVREEIITLPQTARIHQSVACQRCGEMVMATRIRPAEGLSLCIPCAESGQKKGSKQQ